MKIKNFVNVLVKSLIASFLVFSVICLYKGDAGDAGFWLSLISLLLLSLLNNKISVLEFKLEAMEDEVYGDGK